MEAYDAPDPITGRNVIASMFATVRTWLVLALTLGYFGAAHLAFTRDSQPLAAIAVAILVLLILLSIRGPRRGPWQVAIALIGIALVILTARGAPPVLLMLPPVFIPAAIGIAFGRTLLPGRTPLVELVVRSFHAPAAPEAAVIRYALHVTWAWALLLACVALINALLITNLAPGGLLDLAGLTPSWPVPPAAFAWFANTGTYLLIGGMFILEFAVRVWRFPNDRFRNPLRFIREARTRMPEILEALRHG
jgi:uncharacterized membrane protein